MRVPLTGLEGCVSAVERSAAEPLPITSSKPALLWEALCAGYAHVGFDKAAGGDEAFRQLVWRG